MSTGEITEEMRRRFDAAEKIHVGETALARPLLRPRAASLRAHFTGPVGRAQRALQNPHLEPRVSDAVRRRAIPAAVLIAIVLREPEPTVVMTQRPEGISHPGHWVFPGGRADPCDASPIDTALREAHEEIGLDRDRVEVLGRLGDYYSHSGFRIAPTVALIEPPVAWSPQPGEVEAIEEVELAHLVDSANYMLYRFENRLDRAHFALDVPHKGLMLTGVTVSIAIGLYAELLETHASH